jgi:hypothetical protein
VIVWHGVHKPAEFKLSEFAENRLKALAPDVDPSFYAQKTVEARTHPALLQVADELDSDLGAPGTNFMIEQFPKSVKKTVQIKTFSNGVEGIMWSADNLIHRSLKWVRPRDLSHEQLIQFVYRLKRLEYCVEHQPNPSDFDYAN